MAEPVSTAKAVQALWKLKKPIALVLGCALVILGLPLMFVAFAASAVMGAQLTCNGEDTNPLVASRAEVERTARRSGVQPLGAAVLGALFDAAQTKYPTATIDAAGAFRLPIDFAAGSATAKGRWKGPQDPTSDQAKYDSRNYVPAAVRSVTRTFATTNAGVWNELRTAPLTANPTMLDALAAKGEMLISQSLSHVSVTHAQLLNSLKHAGEIDAGAYGDLVSGGVLIVGDPVRIHQLAKLTGTRAFGGAVDTHATSANSDRVQSGATKDLANQQGIVVVLTDHAPDQTQLTDMQDATAATVLWVARTGPGDANQGVIVDDSPKFYATLGHLESLAGSSAPGVLCDSVLSAPLLSTPTEIAAPDPFARDAIAYAYAQIGKPYVDNGAANPPDSWDCSKLTSAAWAQVGINLTAYSYAQYNQVHPITQDLVAPGDLIFWFKDGAHHVAIVDTVGAIPGQLPRVTFVEAANPSRGVVRSELSDGWYRDHLTGFGRVMRPAIAATSSSSPSHSKAA